MSLALNELTASRCKRHPRRLLELWVLLSGCGDWPILTFIAVPVQDSKWLITATILTVKYGSLGSLY